MGGGAAGVSLGGAPDMFFFTVHLIHAHTFSRGIYFCVSPPIVLRNGVLRRLLLFLVASPHGSTRIQVVDKTLGEFPGLLVTSSVPCPACMERRSKDSSVWGCLPVEVGAGVQGNRTDLACLFVPRVWLFLLFW